MQEKYIMLQASLNPIKSNIVGGVVNKSGIVISIPAAQSWLVDTAY